MAKFSVIITDSNIDKYPRHLRNQIQLFIYLIKLTRTAIYISLEQCTITCNNIYFFVAFTAHIKYGLYQTNVLIHS